jgi:ribonucleoside-diphosphate reductase alpha subunit
MSTNTNQTQWIKKWTNKTNELAQDLFGIDVDSLMSRVVDGCADDMSHGQFVDLLAETCAYMSIRDPNYGLLAGRIKIHELYENTPARFSDCIEQLNNFVHIETGKVSSLIHPKVYKIVQLHKDKLDSVIDETRDMKHNFFSFKTLERSYLMRVNNVIVERIQFMWLRVAIGFHLEDISAAISTYRDMSAGLYTHATPTLFNSGTTHPQMSSCFVGGTKVFTINDGPKNIEEVQIGDTVVTHTGSVKPVVQLHVNELGDRQLFQVKCNKTPMFEVTDNHKFWSITKEQMDWNQGPQWNEIKSLRVGDYIAIPKTEGNIEEDVIDVAQLVHHFPGAGQQMTFNYSIDANTVTRITHFPSVRSDTPIVVKKENKPVNRLWKVDEDFAKLIGVWLGDGSIYSDRDSFKIECIRGITITIHEENQELIDFCVRVMNKTFGIKPTVQEVRKRKDHCVNVTLISSLVGDVFHHLFGNYSHGKKLWTMCFQWKRNLVDALLAGLIISDGCVTSSGEIRVTMANIDFIKSVFALCRLRGIPASFTQQHKLKTGASALCATFGIPRSREVMSMNTKVHKDNGLEKYNDDRPNRLEIEINGVYFVRINSKEASKNKPKHVYTLGVQDDHSYAVEGVVAENCFLEKIKDDSFNGIFDTLKQTAIISKYSGGVGINVHEIRGTDSFIQGTNGRSNGLVPMLRVFDATAKYADQGGGKRKGAFAIYLEPWHPDIFEFLEIRTNRGKEDMKTRELFPALWIPDLFMKRVDEDGDWSLFCPRSAPGLNKVWGDKFDQLYYRYEKEGRARRVVKAREIWWKILESQHETGLPFMLYKDSVNRKSNHQHLGTIEGSNLCCEIAEFTSPDEIAVCNLASIALNRFLKPFDQSQDPFYQNPTLLDPNVVDQNTIDRYDFEKLGKVVRNITHNLNKVIDVNYYPVQEARNSNMRHRPVGIGVQGLADLFAKLHLPFGSATSRELNKLIFECIYFNSMKASCELARVDGPYESYDGSPVSNGILQIDMWPNVQLSDRWDWNGLRENISIHGVRNSLLVAPMPTASTSQILGNNECFEPFSSNIYVRRVLSGEFPVFNKHLVNDLIRLGLWKPSIVNQLLKDRGSVKNLDIPPAIKEIYKTVWEISQRVLIDMARDRSPFIDQSQSMNLFMENGTFERMGAMHFYSWNSGLKTGLYYLRTKPSYNPIQFTVQDNFDGLRHKDTQKKPIEVPDDAPLCRKIKAENGEECLVCGS